MLSIILLLSTSCVGLQDRAADSTEVLSLIRKAIRATEINADSVLVYADKAIKLASEIGYSKGVAEAYASLGDYYFYKGDYNKSLENFDQSLRIASKENLLKSKAAALSGKGLVYRRIGAIEKATKSFYEALSIFLQINNFSGAGSCYNSLGLIYRDDKQYDEAIKSFYRAIASYKIASILINSAGALSNIATVYLAKKDNLNALKYCRKSLRMFDSLAIPRGQIVCLNDLGTIHLAMDSIQLAYRNFQDAIQIEKRSGFESYRVASVFGLAKVYSCVKNYDSAISLLNEAIGLAEKRGMKNELLSLYDSLANYYIKVKKYEAAATTFKKFNVLSDSVKSLEIRKFTNNLRALYEFDSKNQEIRELQANARRDKLYYYLYATLPVCALLVVLILYRQQVVKNQKDSLLLEQRNDLMRANYLSKISEGKLIALRAQLNPHFIFNCLNSINTFILRADTQASSEMLLKFAKLVRLILEKSDKKMISFSEELKLMNLYVDLENTRSHGLYRMTVDVDSTIDVETIMVPSLIAQPFVENAVLHAFREKKQENLIKIKYYMEDDLLFCSVEDNGVGRKTSFHADGSLEKNKSMGISISEQRLNLIAGNTKGKKAVTIEDLFNGKGQPSGTKVTVVVPYAMGNDNFSSSQ